jgi:hypothetical protein
MFFIYILKLKDDKYYIGKSRNKRTLNNRLRNHFNRGGAVWTKRHKPIEVDKIINIIDEKYIEDRMVFEYMNTYGIENVRGGSFCKVKLSLEEKNVIKRIINTEENTCFICNSNDHMANECCQNKTKKNNKKRKLKKKYKLIPLPKKLNCCQRITNYFNFF